MFKPIRRKKRGADGACIGCGEQLDRFRQYRCGRCGQIQKPTDDLAEAAVMQFGETDGPVAGGFLLADGRWISVGEDDHRQVNYVVPDERKGDSQTDTMINWMKETGAIRYRLAYRGDTFFLDIMSPVTKAQARQLAKHHDARPTLSYDINTVDNEERKPFRKSGEGWDEFFEIMLPYIVVGGA